MSLFLYVLYCCSLYDVLSCRNFIYRHFFFIHECLKTDINNGLSFLMYLKGIFCIGQFSL